jgi:uridine kinase
VIEGSTTRASVLLIDGRSGSGKTELASAIAHLSPDAELVRLDDLYPGWGGLEKGSALVHTVLLTEHRWQRWDWHANELAEWHELDPSRPLIIEGCGALSARNRALATFGVWVELDSVTRKRRALDRDGDLFARHWDSWAAQEEEFLAREHPQVAADLIVQGDDPLHDVAALVIRRLAAAAATTRAG